MCEKCEKIDKEIESHRRLMAQSDDPDLQQKTAKLIRELIAEKIGLHIVRDK